MTPSAPDRGDVWLIDFSPTVGREQSGMRPGLIISVDTFNHGPAELIVVYTAYFQKERYPTSCRNHPAGRRFDAGELREV